MPIPFLATSLKAAARSLLLSLGMDHALIDFLANTAVGVATVFLAILFVAFRVPRRRSALRLPDEATPESNLLDLHSFPPRSSPTHFLPI